ncbi:MAG: alpha/beta fold hydrolase [Oligosphaeraceae bacterium]
MRLSSQGFFSAGGAVTLPVPGEYDPGKNWLDVSRAGNTSHVDHASVLFQIPEDDLGLPMVFLHGFGQSRLCWMGTPDGRAGWSEYFLRRGHGVFLVDQPRRGEAGSTARMPCAFPDAPGLEEKEYLPGDQAWYTHFRIGRIPPERYAGSQFPPGEEALNQFLRQGTPSTGDYDEALFGAALGEVFRQVKSRTGRKAVYVTHSQGGRVGWATLPENVAAIVAVEPGFCPEPGGEHFAALLAARVPVLVLFGDGIDQGPEDLHTTGFWRKVRDQSLAFAEAYRQAGGDAEVLELPKAGMRGNSHFLFQELNSDAIAALVEQWLRRHLPVFPSSSH